MKYPARRQIFTCLGQISPDPDKTNFEYYIKGLKLTIEYQELSPKTNKPLRAKSLDFGHTSLMSINFKNFLDRCEQPIPLNE